MTLAFSTGLDSFLNIDEIGPLYPFVGAEWLFVVIGFVLWLGWHVLQARAETREEQEAVELYRRIGVDRAMFHGGTALIATDDEWEEAKRTGRAGPHAPPAVPPGAPPP
jgi:hypothetical protein